MAWKMGWLKSMQFDLPDSFNDERAVANSGMSAFEVPDRGTGQDRAAARVAPALFPDKAGIAKVGASCCRAYRDRSRGRALAGWLTG